MTKFDVPTLVLHGEVDQIVPVMDPARKAAQLIKGATEIHYPGARHGITATHHERVNADDVTRTDKLDPACKVRRPNEGRIGDRHARRSDRSLAPRSTKRRERDLSVGDFF